MSKTDTIKSLKSLINKIQKPEVNKGKDPKEKALYDLYFTKKNYVGRDKLWRLAQQHYPDLKISRRFVMSYLKKQELNQISRQAKNTKKDLQPTILKKPFNVINIDLTDMSNQPFKNKKWILTGIDGFSRYGYAISLPDKEGKTVANGFKRIIQEARKKFGKKNAYSQVRSDNGSEFIADEFQKVLKTLKINQVLSKAHSPQSNGLVENFNKQIKHSITKNKLQTGEDDWVSYLNVFLNNYNNQFHRIIKATPLQVMEGDISEEETVDNLKKNLLPKNQGLEKYYKVGDTVRIKNTVDNNFVKKYGDNWSQLLFEIYKVLKSKTPGFKTAYLIKNNDEKYTEKFYYDDLLLVNDVENPITAVKKYKISKLVRPILKKENGKEIKYYEVAWVGYQGENTLEPRSELMLDSAKLITAYEKKHSVEWKKNSVKFSK